MVFHIHAAGCALPLQLSAWLGGLSPFGHWLGAHRHKLGWLGPPGEKQRLTKAERRESWDMGGVFFTIYLHILSYIYYTSTLQQVTT